jgi:hypothetical protein
VQSKSGVQLHLGAEALPVVLIAIHDILINSLFRCEGLSLVVKQIGTGHHHNCFGMHHAKMILQLVDGLLMIYLVSTYFKLQPRMRDAGNWSGKYVDS